MFLQVFSKRIILIFIYQFFLYGEMRIIAILSNYLNLKSNLIINNNL